MAQNFEHVWIQAQDRYLSSLRTKEKQKISSVTSLDELLRTTLEFRAKYDSRDVARGLARVNPLFATLSSFSEVIKTFLQSDPKISALIWGSVCFTLELALRHSQVLETISVAFEQFDRELPRLHTYIQRFGSRNLAHAERLREALVQYYAELLGICQDSIVFLRRPTLSNLILGPFRPLKDKLQKRVAKARDLTAWVDQEASVASDQIQESRREIQHKELLDFLQTEREARVATNHSQETRQEARHSELISYLASANMYLGPVPFHNLPCIPNPTFHGRVALLERLIETFQPRVKPQSLLKAALCGLGGVGKTQLALKYAYDHIDAYAHIFWINSDSSQKLAESFSNLAREMGLADDSVQNDAQLREIFKRYLRVSSKRSTGNRPTDWLLIFDNIEDPRDLELYWPSGANGAVLVTSRNFEIARQFVGLSSTFGVHPFSENEGQTFLLRLIGVDSGQVQGNGADVRMQKWLDQESRVAWQISETLGGLPLALNLVGSHVAATGSSLHTFKETHPAFERSFLFHNMNQAWTSQTYQQSLETTWTYNVAELGKCPQLLIQILAFLDADGVETSFFVRQPQDRMLHGGPDLDMADWDERLHNPFEVPDEYAKYALTILTWYSLLTREYSLERAISVLLKRALADRNPIDNRLSCHRLVQLAIINSMTPEEKVISFSRATYYLNAAFPTQVDGVPLHNQWEACEKVFRQVSALLGACGWLKTAVGQPLLLCNIVIRCAWYLYEKGNFQLATSMINDALIMCNNAWASGEHPGYSEYYVRNLNANLHTVKGAIIEEHMGQGKGLELQEKAKALREEILDLVWEIDDDEEDVKALAGVNCNLSVSLMGAGRAEEALKITESLLDREDTKANQDIYFSNMCICHILLGSLDEALTYSQRAMDLIREYRGEESAQMAIVLFYRGRIYRAQHKLEEAFDELSRCLHIRQNFMPEHHYTGLTYHKLAEIIRERGDLSSSIPMFLKAYSLLELTEYNPGSCCRTAFALAEVYTQVGEFDNAARYLAIGEKQRARIPDPEAAELGTSAEQYDDYVNFAHR